MDGIIVVNKPKGMTSHDVCFKLKKILNTPKIGHTGTLDPMTTGVLVVCIGRATKLIDVLVEHEKEYEAEIVFGKEYDTEDIFGNVVNEMNVNIDVSKIDDVLNSFKGKQIQIPPMYSSIKVNGKKLYEYARKNQEVERPKREITIFDIKRLTEYKDNSFSFYVRGSKGFYVRTLCVDIAKRLNNIGAMKSLNRLSSGNFRITDSYTLNDIMNGNYRLIGLEEILENFDKLVIKDYLIKMVLNGITLDERQIKTDKPFTVYSSSGKLLALYKGDNYKYKPVLIF